MATIEDAKKALPEKILEDLKKALKEYGLSESQKSKAIDKVIELYNKSRIEPGEAIGVVTAQSISEPGTQMSLKNNEKIVIKINNKIKNIEIGKLVDSLMESKGSLKLNHSEVLPLNDLDIYVPSLNEEEKIEWKRVVECSRHKPNKKLMKIKTASGREIVCTDNHSFVTRINNNIVPIMGSELKIGDRIPVLNNFFTDSLLGEISVHNQISYGNMGGGVLYGLRTNTKPMRNDIPLDSLTGWFIGAYLAEGSVSSGSASISNMNDNYINNAKGFISRMGLDHIEYLHQRGFARGRDFRVNSSLLKKFIITSCSHGADNKKVPDFAYSANNEFVSRLLRGYFDGDGNFHVSRKMIRTSSNSKELIDGIALLLSRFKIFSFKTKDKKGQHWLLIPYKYAPMFLAHIGSDIEYKRKSLEELAEKARGFWNSRSQDYTDMISGFGDLFYRTAKKLGYPTRYVNNFTKRQKIGRTALFRYIKLFEELARKKNVDISNELEIMKMAFNSDVIWDGIVSIEYVDSKHEHVYDLSVSGLETFTTFEGIITHNTMRTYHVAGAAQIRVTLGLPRLIEIFDARKSPTTPTMAIFLQKSYNTRDKAIGIANEIKETTVADLISEAAIDILNMRVELAFSPKLLREAKTNTSKIADTLKETTKDLDISERDPKVFVKPRKEMTIKELQKLRLKIMGSHIRGVKNVAQVIVNQSDNEWVINTLGTNLAKVLEIGGIDKDRTTTNDIYETSKVLGIEAARAAIIREASQTLQEQGLDVDIRHIMLVADIMTVDGEIRAIGRYGIAGAKGSVLARANFEETIKHLVKASVVGDVDKLKSIVENVMINQIVPIGTCMSELVFKRKENA